MAFCAYTIEKGRLNEHKLVVVTNVLLFFNTNHVNYLNQDVLNVEVQNL